MKSEPTEEDVYRWYRHVLKSLKANAHGPDSRAAMRKQQALRRAAGKFGLSIHGVKEIVRRQDAINGITHEHPDAYLRKLEREQMRALFESEYTPETTCDTCGRTSDGVYARVVEMSPDAAGRFDDMRFLRIVFRDQNPEWTCMFCTPFHSGL